MDLIYILLLLVGFFFINSIRGKWTNSWSNKTCSISQSIERSNWAFWYWTKIKALNRIEQVCSRLITTSSINCYPIIHIYFTYRYMRRLLNTPVIILVLAYNRQFHLNVDLTECGRFIPVTSHYNKRLAFMSMANDIRKSICATFVCGWWNFQKNVRTLRETISPVWNCNECHTRNSIFEFECECRPDLPVRWRERETTTMTTTTAVATKRTNNKRNIKRNTQYQINMV